MQRSIRGNEKKIKKNTNTEKGKAIKRTTNNNE